MSLPGTVIPAPYMKNPERLITPNACWTFSGFLRTQTPGSSRRGIEIFYATDRPSYCGIYTKQAPRAWLREYARFMERPSSAAVAGYFGYELGYHFEPARWGELPLEEGQRMFQFVEMEHWYEVDHEGGTAKICAVADACSSSLQRFVNYIYESSGTSAPHLAVRNPKAITDEQLAKFGEFSQEEYVEAVEHILSDISAGRYYELNFTQRFSVQSSLHPADAFIELYQRLDPSFAFYANFNNQYIASLSPELFLHQQDGLIQTCPIKGSFRGIPGSVERAKLIAEHIMVVDLARNDIGRISDQAWVHVEEQGIEKTFGEITHLESRISGRTSRALPGVLAATSPAASITGMPKVIAVQSIAQYERSPRGLYTGNCGVLWPNGDFQLNVAIRTLEAESADYNTWTYALGAGGAITADSDPELEYAECLAKARPFLELLCQNPTQDERGTESA